MTPDAAGDLPALQERLRKLESKTGALMLALFMLGGVVAALAITYFTVPVKRVLSARGFVVTDERGQTRAVLGTGPGGNASLTLVDVDGGLRAALAVAADGSPSLTIDGRDGARAVLGAMTLRSPGAWVGERRIERRPAASLVLIHPGRQVFWSAP